MATQEHGTNFWVSEERLTGVLVAVLAHGQHISAVRTLQRLACVLLHEEYRDTGTIDLDDLFEDHANHHRRQTGGRLIEQEQSRLKHQGPRHGYHLALATTEMASA